MPLSRDLAQMRSERACPAARAFRRRRPIRAATPGSPESPSRRQASQRDAQPVSPQSDAASNLAPPRDEVRLDEDCLRHIATSFRFEDFATLARSASISTAWRRAVTPLLATLVSRLEATIEERKSDALLRQPKLWRQRRGWLHETVFTSSGLLRQYRSAPSQQDISVLCSAMTAAKSFAEMLLISNDPKFEARTRIFAEGDAYDDLEAPRLLHRLDLHTSKRKFLPLARLLSRANAAARSEAPQLQARGYVAWQVLHFSSAWQARVRWVRQQPWFTPCEPHEMDADALVRWSIDLIDEVEFFATEEEARNADLQVARLRLVLEDLQERRASAPASHTACGSSASTELAWLGRVLCLLRRTLRACAIFLHKIVP